TPETSASPSALTGVSPTRGGRANLMFGRSSPHGKRRSSRPPRAAFSHSASVGSRAPAHAANAPASVHDRPTTGWRGSGKAASAQKGGGGVPVAAMNSAKSALVAGVSAIKKLSTQTTCAGRSHGWPSPQPIRNDPAGTRAKCTPYNRDLHRGSVSRSTSRGWGPGRARRAYNELVRGELHERRPTDVPARYRVGVRGAGAREAARARGPRDRSPRDRRARLRHAGAYQGRRQAGARRGRDALRPGGGAARAARG